MIVFMKIDIHGLLISYLLLMNIVLIKLDHYDNVLFIVHNIISGLLNASPSLTS